MLRSLSQRSLSQLCSFCDNETKQSVMVAARERGARTLPANHIPNQIAHNQMVRDATVADYVQRHEILSHFTDADSAQIICGFIDDTPADARARFGA